MSDALPPCPMCGEAYTYEARGMLACPMCGHEWSPEVTEDAATTAAPTGGKDAVGNPLVDGDSATVIKDLKITGGGGGVIKAGTKVKAIRFIDGVGDHDIDANVPGMGRLQLKSHLVKKIS